jgi:hypothetical protein
MIEKLSGLKQTPYFRMTFKPCDVKVRDPVLSSEGRKMVWPTYFHTLPPFYLFNCTRLSIIHVCTVHNIVTININVATTQCLVINVFEGFVTKEN